MRKAAFVLLLLLIAGLPTAQTHPYYVSVTEVHLVNQQLEVSVRLFTDDFETALHGLPGGRSADLIKRQPAQIDSLIVRYIRQQVKLELNEKPVALKYVGYEIEEDATWVHLEAPYAGQARKLRIENTLLINYFPAQQNIVHVEQGSFRRSKRLSGGNFIMEISELR